MTQTLLISLEFNAISESCLIHLIQCKMASVFLWDFNGNPVLNYWMTSNIVRLLHCIFSYCWKQQKPILLWSRCILSTIWSTTSQAEHFNLLLKNLFLIMPSEQHFNGVSEYLPSDTAMRAMHCKFIQRSLEQGYAFVQTASSHSELKDPHEESEKHTASYKYTLFGPASSKERSTGGRNGPANYPSRFAGSTQIIHSPLHFWLYLISTSGSIFFFSSQLL